VATAAAVIPVLLTNHKRGNSDSDSNGGPDGNSADGTSGTSGSVITMEDGAKFTYQNAFGGDWAFDPKNPFGSGGKAQTWSKRIGTEDWVWGQDIARGVNLGCVSLIFIVRILQ
jgi:hypothetical protein